MDGCRVSSSVQVIRFGRRRRRRLEPRALRTMRFLGRSRKKGAVGRKESFIGHGCRLQIHCSCCLLPSTTKRLLVITTFAELQQETQQLQNICHAQYTVQQLPSHWTKIRHRHRANSGIATGQDILLVKCSKASWFSLSLARRREQ
jgi:hypothetical protein